MQITADMSSNMHNNLVQWRNNRVKLRSFDENQLKY